MHDDPSLSVAKLPPPRGSFDAWLYDVPRMPSGDGLQPKALLAAALKACPPGSRMPPRLAPAALRAFELQPVAAPLVPAGEAAGAAPAAAPVDLRRQIWELAHRVHDAHSGEWPHSWPRPPFARDPSSPAPAEWQPYAEAMVTKAPRLKPTLESWKAAPETAPSARDALSQLLDCLGTFVRRRRKEIAEGEKSKARREAAEQAERDAALAAEEARLELQQLQIEHERAARALRAELDQLSSARRPDQIAVQAKELELMGLQQRQQFELMQLQAQQQAQLVNARAQQDAPPDGRGKRPRLG
jgi:hypothetical protein